MTQRGQSNTALLLSATLLLSLLSLIVIAIMSMFQITLGKVSEYTVTILFLFTILPATVMAWISLGGRLMYLNEYDDHRDAITKSAITLSLAMVLTTFSYFMGSMIL